MDSSWSSSLGKMIDSQKRILYLLAASARAEAFARVRKRDSQHGHTIRYRENTGRIGEGTNLVRPGDAAAAVHPHSTLTLRSCSWEHPARQMAPGEVGPESTRHDG